MKKKGSINRYKRTGSYTYQKRLPNKDNRMIYGSLTGNGYYDEPISTGEGVENSRVVRVPSLKRNAAWKRFYKLFPHLKGKSVIHGSCQPTVAYGVNPSTIKLKKVKK